MEICCVWSPLLKASCLKMLGISFASKSDAPQTPVDRYHHASRGDMTHGGLVHTCKSEALLKKKRRERTKKQGKVIFIFGWITSRSLIQQNSDEDVQAVWAERLLLVSKNVFISQFGFDNRRHTGCGFKLCKTRSLLVRKGETTTFKTLFMMMFQILKQETSCCTSAVVYCCTWFVRLMLCIGL